MSTSPGHRVPTRYLLRVDAHLDHRWAPWFGALTLTHEGDGTTSLSGLVADQAELYGLLTRVRDLGVTLISVATIEPSAEADPADVSPSQEAPGGGSLGG